MRAEFRSIADGQTKLRDVYHGTTSLPKQNIITVTPNLDAVLKSTLQKIFLQSYQHSDLNITDGQSTDGTPPIIEECHQRISHWVSEEDNRIYDAIKRLSRDGAEPAAEL